MAEKAKKNMVKIKPNSNFHTFTDRTVFDLSTDEKFLEYRRLWHERPANFIVDDFPMHLDIESTNTCNLRCPFCATTFEKWGPLKRGFMDMELFKQIIDEGVRNGLYSVKLSFRGEPLLHPQIAEFVRYAREKGIMDVYFNTNAALLTEDVIDKLLDAGLFRISISVEGTKKEVYEKYRPGAKFEDVHNNIKALRKIRDARNMNFPKIRIQTVLLNELKGSFSSYVDFWKNLADEVSYLDGRKETPPDKPSADPASWACPFLWQRMVLLWDGTMLPCLMHGVSNFDLMSLGNINETKISEAWKSGRFSQYRRLHQTGLSHKIQGCRECSYRAMEVRK